MNPNTKQKIKQINKIQAIIRHEFKHIEHLRTAKNPRTFMGKIKILKKIAQAYIRCMVLGSQIRVIASTPIPKYPSGSACSIVGESGPELVFTKPKFSITSNKPITHLTK